MKVDIRRGTLHDATILSKLSTETFLDTFRGTCTDADILEFVDNYFNIEQIRKELSDPFDFYFIAYLDGEPAGYLRMKEEDIDVPVIKRYKAIELKRIYVVKEYHNKKVGAAMMKFATRFAAEKNYELIFLGVWEHNEKAKAFYKKGGFTDTGVTHDFPIGNTPQKDHWLIKFIGD